MKQLFIIILVFLSSILGYVVYAISQQANEPKTVGELFADIVHPETDELSESMQQSVESKQRVRGGHAVVGINGSINEMPRMNAFMAPATPIKLEISPASDEKWNGQVDIAFTNSSDQRIKIIKPLDGSYYGWYQPHYKFTVVDSNDQELPLGGRCGVSGLWGDTEFPESYLVEIPPGTTHQITTGLPVPIQNSGEYRVTFEYIYDYSQNEANPPKNASDTVWTRPVDGVWQGQLQSNTILIDVDMN